LDEFCQRIRVDFIAQRGGLRRYLFDMLGKAAHRDVSRCRFVGQDGQCFDPDDEARCEVIEFLVSHYTTETLPWGMLIPNGQGEPRRFVF